ncbi:hypothetical protein KDA_49570 [Dictyobacter alpinus]|uniref:Uncharacterized protein n=1 Tax=Dictyobacter alpinus TaxID=2014873 RepID=A0A402BDI8_9CHLR|nr:hypothetical protein [Dictyobacter alpinus]GCE29473.1 hypothetical protein KDA_49570 [Dictyobacter alpinus]
MDVSQLVATLVEEPGRPQSDLLEELGDAICHQGDIYDAEARFVVPYFFAFLPQALTKDKIHVLGLLGVLIRESWKQFPTPEESYRKNPLYRMLCEGIPIYRELLGSKNRELRMLCAFLLGYCRSETVDIPGCLKAQYKQESDEYVQFALIKALTLLQTLTNAERAEVFRTTISFVIRHALSLAIAQVEGDETPSAVAMVLLEGLLNTEALDLAYNGAPYPTCALCAILDVTASFSQQRHIHLLITAIERYQITSRMALLHLITIIEHLFQLAEFPQEVFPYTSRWITPITCEMQYRARHGARSEPFALTDLTGVQYQALLCLLHCEDFWRQKTNLLACIPSQQQEKLWLSFCKGLKRDWGSASDANKGHSCHINMYCITG